MQRRPARAAPVLLLAAVALAVGTGAAIRIGAQVATPVVGLDEANHRHRNTDPIYGWSIDWDPSLWQGTAQLVMDVDRDGSLLNPDVRLAAVPGADSTPAAGAATAGPRSRSQIVVVPPSSAPGRRGGPPLGVGDPAVAGAEPNAHRAWTSRAVPRVPTTWPCPNRRLDAALARSDQPG